MVLCFFSWLMVFDHASSQHTDTGDPPFSDDDDDDDGGDDGGDDVGDDGDDVSILTGETLPF